MKIHWCKNIEPENKVEIEKYLNPFLWLVPKWCQLINIYLYPTDGDSGSIATTVDYEYRKIKLEFYTGWLNAPPEKKQSHVVHECIHFFVNTLYHQARSIVIATSEDNDKFQKFTFEELRVTVESVTQDLAYAILEKFNER